jgi:hypothetical protein
MGGSRKANTQKKRPDLAKKLAAQRKATKHAPKSKAMDSMSARSSTAVSSNKTSGKARQKNGGKTSGKASGKTSGKTSDKSSVRDRRNSMSSVSTASTWASARSETDAAANQSGAPLKNAAAETKACPRSSDSQPRLKTLASKSEAAVPCETTIVPPEHESDDDDDDETCPTCIEKFDQQDKKFYPCPCKYRVCVFCVRRIQTEFDGRCPGCRRDYNEDDFAFLDDVVQLDAVTAQPLASVARVAGRMGDQAVLLGSCASVEAVAPQACADVASPNLTSDWPIMVPQCMVDAVRDGFEGSPRFEVLMDVRSRELDENIALGDQAVLLGSCASAEAVAPKACADVASPNLTSDWPILVPQCMVDAVRDGFEGSPRFEVLMDVRSRELDENIALGDQAVLLGSVGLVH